MQVDVRNHRKDGSLFWNRLAVAPAHDAAGTLSHRDGESFPDALPGSAC